MKREVHAVTGAFGYSGLHVARLLLEQGARRGHAGRGRAYTACIPRNGVWYT